MAAKGHYGAGGGTKQGIYVCTPGGQFLASINSSSPSAVKKMLERSMEKWNQLPEKTRTAKPPVSKPTHRWETSLPKNGLILKETIRYLSDDPKSKESRFNFDFAWFNAEEADRFLPQTPKAGQEYQVPQKLFQRIALIHLLNSAQGESGIYRANELRGQLVGKVVSIDGQTIKIRISGTSRVIAKSQNDAHWRARRIDAELLGFAVFRRSDRKPIKFDLVAKGKIFRKAEQDPAKAQPMGWYFTMADQNNPFEKISPTHLYAYNGKWVRKPQFTLHGLPRSKADALKMKNKK